MVCFDHQMSFEKKLCTFGKRLANIRNFEKRLANIRKKNAICTVTR
jgi:hypothetical protein